MNFAEQLQYIMDTEHFSVSDVAMRTKMTEVTIRRYLKEERSPNVRDAKWVIESLGYELAICKKKSKKIDLKKNGSGCYDPTAYKAIKKADVERERLTRLLDVIFTICEYAGFHVEDRITLKDKRTGKIWK